MTKLLKKINLIVFWILSLLVAIAMIINHFSKSIYVDIFYNKYFLFIFGLIATYIIGKKYIKNTYYEVFKWKRIGMNLLIFISTQSAFLFSIYQLIVNQFPELIEVCIFVILFVLTGDTINDMLRKVISSDLKSLTTLQPKKVMIKTDDNFVEKEIYSVEKDTTIKVLTNQVIPLDARLITPIAQINTQIIDGENTTKRFYENDHLFAGMINKGNEILLSTTSKFYDSFLNKVVNKVATIQSEKSGLQNIVDKIAQIFTPLVIIISIASFFISYFWLNQANIYESIKVMITVLVSACPCSIGIAIPFAVMIGSTKAAKKGVIFNKPDAFGKTSKVNVIAFDKTGTLTKGEVSVKNFIGDKKYLDILGQFESTVSHPLATGFLNYLRNKKVLYNQSDSFVKKSDTSFSINKLNYSLMPISNYQDQVKSKIVFDKNKIYKTATLLLEENQIVALIEFDDVVREEAKRAISILKKQHYEVVMITGDNNNSANYVAKKLDIDVVHSEKTIKQKLELIENYQKQNKKVLFVGDGMNDILAMQKANLSISIVTNKTYLDLESDISLLNPNISLIVDSIKYAKYTKKIILSNLFWAFIYNIILIPLAIFNITNPMIGMFAMFCSSILVLLNSLVFKLKR
ncbi:copper-transporting ATPase [Spiroplasma helicoides]|uniref:Copper-transporting ATPase n=1 Tax=Spiroplasma helicoides TaxID=216938 RepID=A0A1B3SM99_9MOLU|nr:cation-translocating P-type ATPase [Spiroplasma helicoides]AOG61058.1 copper-transporting ATPase [Spiroplasma helicoides]